MRPCNEWQQSLCKTIGSVVLLVVADALLSLCDTCMLVSRSLGLYPSMLDCAQLDPLMAGRPSLCTLVITLLYKPQPD